MEKKLATLYQGIVKLLIVPTIYLMSLTAFAKNQPSPGAQYYGVGLCQTEGFHCIKVKRGQSWRRLFKDERERDLVQRLNRSDTYLYSGRMLAVPDHLAKTTLLDIAPYPHHIKPRHEKIIIVDQDRLAWGAYDRSGRLVKWGPISSGKDYCPDIHRSCRTITGIFYVFIRKGKNCRSNKFPVGRGGSKMPFCMFFYKGYALHGSNEVFGRRASHGCIRLFTKDAEWLNKNFVDVPDEHGGLGTKVIVQKLVTVNRKGSYESSRKNQRRYFSHWSYLLHTNWLG